MTLHLSKRRFFTIVFLVLSIHETKVRNVHFHNFSLKVSEILKIQVRNGLNIVVESIPGFTGPNVVNWDFVKLYFNC